MAKPGHIYHWKHGWIPITPRAAMVKAKGRHSTADKYMHRYGIEDHRLEGRDRRQGGHVDIGDKRNAEHRGQFRYVRGTRTRDYPTREDYKNASAGHVPASGGPKSESEARRLTRPELEPHAEAGNKHAQTELERRAANRAAKKAGTKPAPAPREPKAAPAPKTTEPPLHPAPPAPKMRTVAEHDDREIATELFRRGLTLDKDGHLTPGGANRTGDVPPAHPTLEHLGDNELARELNRRGVSVGPDGKPISGAWGDPPANPNAGHQPKPAAGSLEEHKAAVKAEDQKINTAMRELGIGEGHRVSGIGHRDLRTGGMTVSSYHYDDTESRYHHVGIVRQNSDGTFTAHRVLYTAKGNEKKDKPVLGTQFASRKDAHLSIMAHHELAKHQDADRKTETAGKAREAAAEAAKARAARAEAFRNVPGPHGTSWELHEMPNDGTTIGAKAAAKAKLSLKAGNTTVVVESDLSDEQAKAFLHNVTSAREKVTPNLGDKPVKFYVPSGHKKFGPSSQTGAFVYYGDSTVWVNPRMASGDQHNSFSHAAHAGHFMPAGKSGSIGEYTLIHELGHVVDGQNRHTRPMDLTPTDSKGFTAQSRKDHRAAVALGHSMYGKDNPAEGYAEAFAQWTLEGKGSNAVSDHYAERFGWAEPPAAHTADRQALLANKAALQARLADRSPDTPEFTRQALAREAAGRRIDGASSSFKPAVGGTVHIGTDLRYHGKGTVKSINEAEGTAIVEIPGRGTGRVSLDQLHATKLEAQAHVKPTFGSGSLAAMGGNRAARKLARQADGATTSTRIGRPAPIPTVDTTAAALARRAVIAKKSTAELEQMLTRHTNPQTLRFIRDELAKRKG